MLTPCSGSDISQHLLCLLCWLQFPLFCRYWPWLFLVQAEHVYVSGPLHLPSASLRFSASRTHMVSSLLPSALSWSLCHSCLLVMAAPYKTVQTPASLSPPFSLFPRTYYYLSLTRNSLSIRTEIVLTSFVVTICVEHR